MPALLHFKDLAEIRLTSPQKQGGLIFRGHPGQKPTARQIAEGGKVLGKHQK